MENFKKLTTKEYLPYLFMLGVDITLLASAFAVGSPHDAVRGFFRVFQSHELLVTDYVALGGLGGSLLNVSVVGLATLLLLIVSGVRPSGANIMALWMCIGFAFYGKNIFNMIPLTFGVWVFSKYRREPFSKYCLPGLLVATLCPTVSVVVLMGIASRPIEIAAGILLGFLMGFIFPYVAAGTVKAHSGYNLYNMGFAGGLVATILASVLKNLGIAISPAGMWGSGNNLFFAILLYFFSGAMLLTGAIAGRKASFSGYLKIHSHTGKLATDYLALYKDAAYINMAVLCFVGTSLVLAVGGEINGPVLAGILTMTGFGSLGMHIKNVAPVLAGALAAIFANRWDPAVTSYTVPLLFSSGLAPISGKHGLAWGAAAGFLCVNVVVYVSVINGGLNLYNNGFAAGFVAMFLLPVISAFKRGDSESPD